MLDVVQGVNSNADFTLMRPTVSIYCPERVAQGYLYMFYLIKGILCILTPLLGNFQLMFVG